MVVEAETLRTSTVVLRDCELLACGACGWVHYAMTLEQRIADERNLGRYNLTLIERSIYQSAYRQCLRCEAPVAGFRRAEERDLVKAAGHLVTPVIVDNS